MANSIGLIGLALGVTATSLSAVNYESIITLNHNVETLSALSNGLTPNLPVKTNDFNKLISQKIGLNDLDFSPVTTPLSENFNCNSNSVTNIRNLQIESLLNVPEPSPGVLTLFADENSFFFITPAGVVTQLATNGGLGYLSLGGGTLSGNLRIPTGSGGTPSLQVGAVDVGLSSSSGNLQLSTAFGVGLSISSAAGLITLPSLSSAGVVHNSFSGLLSTSLILDADITVGTIGNDKLVTLTTPGLVSNAATTAVATNTIDTIVLRDGSGNFSAGTITATLTGHSSLDLALTGGTLSGNLQVPVGSGATPSLQVGAVDVGLSSSSGNLQLSTAFGVGLSISSAAGLITLPSLSSAGVVHNSLNGLLSTSLILDADITVGTIGNDKLVTLTTPGLVSNAATTAVATNTIDTIVLRDGSGDFSAGTITATLTGHSSLDLALTGGTLSGSLQVPVGSGVTPSLQVGAVDVGLSSPSGNLQLSTAFGVGLLISSAAGLITLPSLSSAGVVHNSSSGLLSTSLILDADITVGTIGNDKLVTLTTPGLVSNAATTAVATNTIDTIVLRDGSGNFSAGTITATLTGHSSLDLALTGGTLSGNLQVPAGLGTISLQVGAANIGLSSAAGALLLSTAFGVGITIGSLDGSIKVTSLASAGVVHSSETGVLSTSLILDADITVGTIGNNKLVTLTTPGLVSNAATTAVSTNTINTIVLRDGSGNFSAGTITATLTGHSSLDLALTGGALSGALTTNSSIASSLATDSTTTLTGSITTAGGVGIVKNLYVGGSIVGTLTTDSSSISTGSLLTAGGLGVTKKIFAGGAIRTTDTTASSSVSTGSLIADGGLGVAGAVFIGGNITLAGTINWTNGDADKVLFRNSTDSNKIAIASFGQFQSYAGTLASAGGSGVQGQFQWYTVNAGLTAWQSVATLSNGGNFTATGSITASSTTVSSSISTGSLIAGGGLGVAGAAFIGGAIRTTNTTVSSSVSTGSLIADGGLGVAGAAFIGGAVRTTNTTVSSSVSTGSLIADGGLGVAGAAFFGGAIRTTNTTVSSSVSTGSLIGDGGLGVAGKAYIGGSLNVAGTGSATGDFTANVGLFAGATAANLYAICVNKTGIDAIAMGVNKNSTTGSIPATATFISTYQSTSVLSIGRGNGAGLPSTSDILINSNGSVTLASVLASSSISTGSLVTGGGLGVGGDVYAGGFMYSNSAPPMILRFSTGNPTANFSSTTAETSMLSSNFPVGTLAVAAATTGGFVLQLFNSFLYSSGAATTFTIRLKVAGTTVLTAIIPAATIVNQFIHLTHTLQLRDSPTDRIYITSNITRDGGGTLIQGTIVDSLWVRANANTISCTGQFSDTNGSFRCDGMYMTSSH